MTHLFRASDPSRVRYACIVVAPSSPLLRVCRAVRAVQFILATLLLMASTVAPFQPTGDTRRNLWTIPAPGDTIVNPRSGTHFFAAILSSKSKKGGPTSLWLNGSVVWKGQASPGRIVVDQAGNWAMMVQLWKPGPPATPGPVEVWINGELTSARLLVPDPQGNRFVWLLKSGNKECITGFSGTVGCAPKIMTVKWLHSGIFWVEVTEKDWIVHTPEGRTRRVPLPAGKNIFPFLDDFGGLWWKNSDDNLYSERDPSKAVISKQEGWDSAFFGWDQYFKSNPGARSGELIRRDARPTDRMFPWNRESPFRRSFYPYPIEGRADGEFAFVCGRGIESIAMGGSPRKAAGMFAGEELLLGTVQDIGDAAVFYDCTGAHSSWLSILSPTFVQRLAIPVWLGSAAPPFRFVRGITEDGGLIDFIDDDDAKISQSTWAAPTDVQDARSLSHATWLNGPPYWAGWWQWNQRGDGLTVSWVTESLDDLMRAGRELRATPARR